jgi:CRP-like cAMP-binding protein
MIASQNSVPFDPLKLDEIASDITLYLRSSGMLNEAEIEVMSQMVYLKTFKKGSFLLKEGQIASHIYYNLKGCVREYYLKDAEEKTINFYTEGDTIAHTSSYILRVPAKHYLECVEDTTVTVISYENDRAFNERFPRFNTICNGKTEEQLGRLQEIVAEYMVSTPEERYLKLVETRPDLLNRVPQYQLASYVGVTPESLSRIRNRIRLSN